nr:hypothetical protein [Tanacetum cinerariifolium]
MAEGEIDNLTMKQYLALTRGNQASAMVKPDIGGIVNFKIKSQFMRELRYCPPSRTAKQLEEIRNFMQEGDETLYQAWEWNNDLLYKCPTYDINNHQKVNIFYNGLRAMNRQFHDSQGPIPGMTLVQALTAIQTMADHSQKWHDGSSSKNIKSSSNSKWIATIVNKLENLGQDMKKLKENVHAIQVGCQTYEGAQLNKDYPLNEEVKGMEEIKYREFSRSFPNNIYDDIFNKGGYDQPSLREKRHNLIEIINKYTGKASKRQAEQEEWLTKFYQSTEASRETHDKIIQGLKRKVKTLANEVKGRANNKKFKECKTIYSKNGLPLHTPFYYSPEEIEYFSAILGFSKNEEQETDDSGIAKAVAVLEATLKKKREEPKNVK